MQKKLIALAVAAAAAAPVFAQSNVTIYGQVRVSVDHFDMQAANSDRWTVSDQASRIGFKGAEDLGNGLKAVWQWESNLNNTSNAAATGGTAMLVPALGGTQRNTFLGLAGGFGTVLFGTHDTPYKLGGSADLFGDTAADAQCSGTTNFGTAAPLTSANPTCIIGRNGFDSRLTNVVAYVSPTWSGFHFAVAGVAGEGSGTAIANASNGLSDAYSMVAVYENGPMKATLGHEVVTADAVSAYAGAAGAAKLNATKLNLAYKVGAIGLGYTYERSTDASATSAGGASLTVRDKDVGQLLSVSYSMGATTLGLQMGKFDNRASGDAAGDLKTWTIGAYHGLSKRTTAYIGYHNADPQGDTNNAKVLTMGLNHSF